MTGYLAISIFIKLVRYNKHWIGFELSFSLLGLLLNTAKIFEPLNDFELFDDAHFWSIPDESPKKDLNETTAVEMATLQS